MTDQVKDQVEEKEEKEKRLSTSQMVEAFKPGPKDQAGEEERSALLSNEKATDFRSRWSNIQASFVDEPRKAVEEADALVAEVMQYLAQTFADERQKLEAQWVQGQDVSTEDLRIGLQRYRSFFSRLLSV